jgi:hypothetical protein
MLRVPRLPANRLLLRSQFALFSTLLLRPPELNDVVKLSAVNSSHSAAQTGVVTLIDQSDTSSYYRVCFSSSSSSSSSVDSPPTQRWFPQFGAIELDDPAAVIPKPVEPLQHECCGSECPDCVWIKYWERLNKWEALTKAS